MSIIFRRRPYFSKLNSKVTSSKTEISVRKKNKTEQEYFAFSSKAGQKDRTLVKIRDFSSDLCTKQVETIQKFEKNIYVIYVKKKESRGFKDSGNSNQGSIEFKTIPN